jgi:hypothetical protein
MYETASTPLMIAPQFGIGDFLCPLPYLHTIGILSPPRFQVPVVQPVEVPRNVRGDVNTVRYVANRDIRSIGMRPHLMPHVSGNLTVQPTHSISSARQFQAENGHAEAFGTIFRSLSAQSEKGFEIHPQSWDKTGEVLLHEPSFKDVIPRRYRCMYGEDTFAGSHLTTFLGGQAFVFYVMADSLQKGERGVAFVEMIHGRGNAHRTERAASSNSQKDLLTDTHFLITAIQPGSGLAHMWGILGDIRVEQIELHSAHVDFENLEQEFLFRKAHLQDQRGAGGISLLFHRERVKLRPGIVFLLPSLLGEPLPEVSFLIHESHSNER